MNSKIVWFTIGERRDIMNISNWATLEEFKKILEGVNLETGVQKSGIPIAYDDNYLYIDSKERHNLIIGSTGSGKTQAIILPMLKLAVMAGEVVRRRWRRRGQCCKSGF